MRPQVSVIIPVHNRSSRAQLAAASALSQSFADLELIVVDDGSDVPFAPADGPTDDPRLRLLRLERNSGPAAARNAGVAQARGELIAFLDSDDIWLPHKLERQLPAFERAAGQGEVGRLALATGFVRVDAAGRRRSAIPIASADPADFASGCWFCPGSTVLLAREAFERVGPFDDSLMRLEDLDWFLRFSLKGGRLEVVEEVLAEIRASGKPDPDIVSRAADRIGDKLGGPDLAKANARRLKAYLALERSSASWHAGRRLRAGVQLARSMILAPRLSLALRPFWKAPGP